MRCDRKGATKCENTRRGKLTKEKELILHQNRRRAKKKQRKTIDASVQV
jgi:hypothetical protein